MALKKSELYSSLWKGCDELRGGMDASQYKDYVLTLLFVKYVSDRSDRTLLDVPEGASFADITRLRNDIEIGDKINKIIARLAEANDLRGVIDIADFNDENKLGRGKEMVDRLSKLVGIFDSLDFGANSAGGDDLLGDAYEYLMRHFATESGKSKGQFYTPAEVSMILAHVVGISPATKPDQTVYDPTCGSGALLLKAAHEAPAGMSVYGQEMDNATYALARMNMILHGYETAELWQDNTLSSPHYKNPDGTLRTFDFAVANPPFSTKAWTSGLDPANDQFKRFDGFGIPPDKNGDYAFLLHLVKSLKSTGKGAIILPHGVLFRGNREADIRRELVKRHLIKGIIGLPANLFYGTGIPACIIVLDKENAASRSGIFMIDASKGFIKDGNKNRLRAQDIHKIVDVFTRESEVDGYSRLVPFDEIGSTANDYNLNLPRYIDSSEPEDIQDLDAHVNGGIPERDINALSRYWSALPGLREALFENADRPGYIQLKVPITEVKAAILGHPDFVAFVETATGHFAQWRDAQTSRLKGIAVGDHPKELIASLAEQLLQTFFDVPLIDAYDMYQHLLDFWDEVMQDDAYQLVQAGWNPVLDGKPNTDLIPNGVIVERYFRVERAEQDALVAERDAATQAKEELDEEHSGEDGLFADARTDSGALSGASVKARLSEVKSDPDAADEREALQSYLALLDREAASKKMVKASETALGLRVASKYADLSEGEVKKLVVEDKWLAQLDADVQGELGHVSQTLTGRIGELAERYATPLPELAAKADAMKTLVDEHLRKMGVSWR
jgi:type I restriction enzyme M protein